MCVIDYYSKARETNVTKKNHKAEKIHLQYLVEKNPHVSGPTQFKPVLFMG